jgi:membrane associated rhomboid family serine protease
MVLPLGDDNSDRGTIPWVNYGLILANVLVFVFWQNMGNNENVLLAWAVVPEEIVTGRDVVTSEETPTTPLGQEIKMPGLEPTPVSVYLTLLVSMFLHGGLMHLLGNMLFLWVFGDNVEDQLGPLRYLGFYLLCGVVAALSHVALTYAISADPRIPCVGASGAISGVLGAYVLLFPLKRVTVLVFRVIMEVPAFVAVGAWFVLQAINALGALGHGSRTGGGVAYGAHVGGFLAGMLLIYPFALGRKNVRSDQSSGYTPRREVD